MAIETEFRFSQIRDKANLERLSLDDADLLGHLRAFVGENHSRTWSGPGFNMIWRPHDKSGDNNQDFFLELDVTKETLSFTDVTGLTGIANRGLLQKDIVLGGVAYQQEVSDVTREPIKPLHFEPGVWLNIPSTTDPSEEGTVARLGSIPHGTTINAQGRAFIVDGKPQFKPVSITPFRIGSPDDGATDLVNFPEGQPPIATAFPARTSQAIAVGLDDAHFADLIKILSDVTDRQNVKRTTVFEITTDLATKAAETQAVIPGIPKEGSGTNCIAFLEGSANGPNARVARMSAIFWIEEIEGENQKTFLQLQYVQRVLLNFNGLSWPHVSLATMVIVDDKK